MRRRTEVRAVPHEDEARGARLRKLHRAVHAEGGG